jgi:hypothetical protein
MVECKDCAALVDQPTSVKPHDGLSIVHTAVRADGDVVTYSCRRCGAQWQRFKTNATFRGEPQYWHRL